MSRVGSTTISKKIYARFSHFNQDSVVVLHEDELVSYDTDKEFEKKLSVKHGIPNLSTQFITAKMDHSGEIFILSGTKMYIFSDLHNFKRIGTYDKSNFDKETQERFTKFTSILDFSDYRTIASMVSGDGYIFEIR